MKALTMSIIMGVYVMMTSTPVIVRAMDQVLAPDVSDLSTPCPQGWHTWNRTCYYYNETRYNFDPAMAQCASMGAQMVAMETEEENEFVAGINPGHVWAAYRTKTRGGIDFVNVYDEEKPMLQKWGYMHPLRHRGVKGCVYFGSNGNLISSECIYDKNLMCERPQGCQAGYVRNNGECQPCHCLGQNCSWDQEECPHGCELGWMGRGCTQRKLKVEVVYYCMTKPEAGRKEMLFNADQHGIKYKVMRFLNEDGDASIDCRVTTVIRPGQTLLQMKYWQEGRMDNSPCGYEQVDNNTYKWLVEFQEVSGVYSPYDATFELQCNFSEADNTQRTAVIRENPALQYGNERLEPTHLQVDLFVVQSGHLNVSVTDVSLGDSIQLAMNMTTNKIGVHAFSPYNCVAKTTDGSQSKILSNEKGCIVGDSPVKMIDSSPTFKLSRPFQAFMFRGHREVQFTCSFNVCNRASDRLCSNRCRHQTSYGKRYDADDETMGEEFESDVTIRVHPLV